MSNGGMQPTYGPVTDNTCPTVGGNQTIINGNEATQGCGFTGLLYRMNSLQTSAYTTSW